MHQAHNIVDTVVIFYTEHFVASRVNQANGSIIVTKDLLFWIFGAQRNIALDFGLADKLK